jgi:hypothetical protein
LIPQNGPKRPQDEPKRGQGHPKTATKGDQEGQKREPKPQDGKRTEPRRPQDRLGPPKGQISQNPCAPRCGTHTHTRTILGAKPRGAHHRLGPSQGLDFLESMRSRCGTHTHTRTILRWETKGPKGRFRFIARAPGAAHTHTRVQCSGAKPRGLNHRRGAHFGPGPPPREPHMRAFYIHKSID